jgi:hypothetical protein
MTAVLQNLSGGAWQATTFTDNSMTIKACALQGANGLLIIALHLTSSSGLGRLTQKKKPEQRGRRL